MKKPQNKKIDGIYKCCTTINSFEIDVTHNKSIHGSFKIHYKFPHFTPLSKINKIILTRENETRVRVSE